MLSRQQEYKFESVIQTRDKQRQWLEIWGRKVMEVSK